MSVDIMNFDKKKKIWLRQEQKRSDHPLQSGTDEEDYGQDSCTHEIKVVTLQPKSKIYIMKRLFLVQYY